ncbi:MAG: hypothetical protein K0B87_09140 [Candidatus Syntrophosphaera sp.]|nr:hypothetical protein [Candidatus Syntrophosphaera sp.]
MKKTLMFLMMMAAALGLAAQTGLFGISFGDDLNRADSLMSQAGFVAEDVEGTMVKYYSDYNKLVESVVLFVQPDMEWVAGWFVLYYKENTEQQDRYVLDRLHRMHGEEVLIDQEAQFITWFFDDTRTVTYGYASTGNLCVYYHDSHFEEVFDLPPSALRRITESKE